MELFQDNKRNKFKRDGAMYFQKKNVVADTRSCVKIANTIKGLKKKRVIINLKRSDLMRLWHYGILETLPELQLRSQWRECIAIAKDLHETGFTHHLLINRIMSYNKQDFNAYCYLVLEAMIKRGISPKEASCMKLHEYTGFVPNKNLYVFDNLYNGWHNKEYLRVCVCNLYEKYHFGVGKSKITQDEWDRILQGYKNITGEDWVL